MNAQSAVKHLEAGHDLIATSNPRFPNEQPSLMWRWEGTERTYVVLLTTTEGWENVVLEAGATLTETRRTTIGLIEEVFSL